jgi:hypothetical protein
MVSQTRQKSILSGKMLMKSPIHDVFLMPQFKQTTGN